MNRPAREKAGDFGVIGFRQDEAGRGFNLALLVLPEVVRQVDALKALPEPDHVHQFVGEHVGE